jgi:hypothetical protein
MSKQTAVEWLGKELESYGDPQFCKIEWEQLDSLIQQAKEMEKEQIMKTARQCHFEGVRQSAKTSQEYIDYSEQYYNETYGGNK